MSLIPNCTTCIHRDQEPPKPGLIACGHPIAMNIRSARARLLDVATGWGPIDGNLLGVKISKDKWIMGVATWPFFFDPRYLLTCDGFEVASA